MSSGEGGVKPTNDMQNIGLSPYRRQISFMPVRKPWSTKAERAYPPELLEVIELRRITGTTNDLTPITDQIGVKLLRGPPRGGPELIGHRGNK